MIILEKMLYVGRYSRTMFLSKHCLSRNSKIRIENGAAGVATWTQLGSVFNTKTTRKLNLSLTRNNTGLFNVAELKDPEGFYLLKDRVFWKSEDLVNEACSPSRSRKLVDVFDDLSDALCQVADLAEFVRNAHPDAKFATAAEDACVNIGALVEKLNTNKALYLTLKHVIEGKDIVDTDSVDYHVGKLFLFDFEQSGIHLDEEKRKLVVKLNAQILQLGSFFMQRSLQPRSIHKDQLPTASQHLFPLDGDYINISGLYADSPNNQVRELAYKIYLHPDQHQEELLQDLLTCRYHLAQLCGFKTYAHRALRGSLANDPETVITFLEELAMQLKDEAQREFIAMATAKNPKAKDLQPWDVPYFTALLKNERYKVHVPDYMPYFSLGTCMEGLNNLLNSLYGITLQLQEPEPGEIWNPDVQKVAAVDSSNCLLGYIYCDFLERPGKPHQDCHFTIRGGRQLKDGSYQLPLVVLLLNFPQPTWSTPSLLTPGMVDNLFHEMGHAIHSMMARTKHQHVTGTRCCTDFAEVPSVLMEYFASDPRVLSTFARHFKTGQAMPPSMIQNLCASKTLFSASEMQLQVFYSILDQIFHGVPSWKESRTTTDILSEVQNKYYFLPHIPNTAWQLRFSHLVGYGAKYYSYLMSRAVASSIWQQCFLKDPFSSKMGERFRQEVLSHGGGIPAKDLIEGFLRRTVTPQSLVDSLITEISQRKHKL